MKIILTGGAGFIGSELSEYIISNLNKSDIKIIDNLSRGYKQRIKKIKKKVMQTLKKLIISN